LEGWPLGTEAPLIPPPALADTALIVNDPADVSPENDGRSKLAQGDGFGGQNSCGAEGPGRGSGEGQARFQNWATLRLSMPLIVRNGDDG